MAEGGIVPPHSVLAPGTALGLLLSRALPSAQVPGMVFGQKVMFYGKPHREESKGTKLRTGCSI